MTPNTRTLKGQSYCSQRWANPVWPKGSKSRDFSSGIHVGYEHNYALRKGWKLFWQAKCDLMIKGEDLFRTGIVIGVKIPTK